MFGFGKKKKKRAAEQDEAAALRELGLDKMPRPRDQHYVFGHIVLRQLAERHSLALLSLLAEDDKAVPMLRELWSDVHADTVDAAAEKGEAPPEAIPPTGLAVTRCTVADRPTAIITLPPAERMAECHFVAMVAKLPLDEMGEEDPGLRYFTLEKGVSADPAQTPRTVLCEWGELEGEPEAGPAHLNYGDGPTEVTPEAFAACLDDHLQRHDQR